MVTLAQHIIELQSEIYACPDPVECFKLRAELTAARFQYQRSEANAQRYLQEARRNERQAIYHPQSGMVSHQHRAFSRKHLPIYNAGQLAAKLEEIALELHLAYADQLRGDVHICLALERLNELQWDLYC